MLALLPSAVALACAGSPPRESYRLGVASPSLEGELRAAYPDFFAVVLDPRQERDPDLRPIRADLEASPSGPRSYDALNAVAFAYFTFNHRAESDPGGERYLADSFRAAKVVAVPWRAYGEVEDERLRGAILDFFADASFGDHPMSAGTAPRLLRVVDSLRKKEQDPARLARIDAIVDGLAARTPPEALE